MTWVEWQSIIGNLVLTALALGTVVLIGCGAVALVKTTSRHWRGR